jgi:uncharacterized membrane protein YbhN (UPF0104 family)
VKSRAVRLAAFSIVFAALVAMGIAWVAPSREELSATSAQLRALPASVIALLGFFALAGFGVEMLRFVTFARLVGVKLGWRAALETTIANHLFSWIMPGPSVGEPVAVYVLVKHGVPVEEAAVLTFAKLLTSIAFIFGITFVLIVAGVGPALPSWVAIALAAAAGGAALCVSAMLVGAARPKGAIALVDRALPVKWLAARAKRSIELVGAAKIDWRGALAALVVHALYYAVFIAPLVTLAVALGAPAAKTASAAIVYQGVVYLAPTPGGAGVGEATATLFFGGLLPPASAFVVVIVFRALTYYLHIVVGFVALPFSRAVREFLRGGAT